MAGTHGSVVTQAWKLKYLNEHLERLLRLASNETLREELTAFPLAVSCEDGIQEQHRPGQFSLITIYSIASCLHHNIYWMSKHGNMQQSHTKYVHSHELAMSRTTAYISCCSAVPCSICQLRMAYAVCAGLVKVLTRVLWPKMRKRSGRLGGRGAPGSARAAVLNFLAAAQPQELTTLLLLVFQPISAAFEPPSSSSASTAATETDR